MAKKPNAHTPRHAYHLCHEVAHYILQIQANRIENGLPHTSIPDVMNDLLVEYFQEHAKRLGLKAWKDRDEAA